MAQPKGPFCQSCLMPMQKPEDFGTNADTTRNEDYCRFCFQGGNFTRPDMTMEQMIDLLAGMASKMNMSEAQARAMAQAMLPRLKRWRRAC